jgi:hypothetical protein
MSPLRMPAAAAGESRNGRITRNAQVGVLLGVEIRRIGIEPADEPTQRVVDERGMLDVVDVLALHTFDDFVELGGFRRRERRLPGGGGGRLHFLRARILAAREHVTAEGDQQPDGDPESQQLHGRKSYQNAGLARADVTRRRVSALR